MQERKDPWDPSSKRPRASLNGAGDNTGKQRVPQRPRSMTRLDTPPATPRVNRPERQQKPPRSWRRRLLIFGSVLVILFIVVFIVVYGIANYFISIGASAGAADAASNFVVDLQTQKYSQTDAYQYLDASLTITISPQQFQQMATADDTCYGVVTNSSEVQGSATISADGNTQTYTYSMTRSKLSKPYPLKLTLQKDSNGTWDITNYGGDLGPSTPSPTCK